MIHKQEHSLWGSVYVRGSSGNLKVVKPLVKYGNVLALFLAIRSTCSFYCCSAKTRAVDA